ncbi:4a-hydroxytetrahydrobiopterin dehydratase [Candidatus Sumerlaeota bacterium]|nr:4a-hydroxytetrahydrobiopterin dehydratase [Candidatus Sumerlaeota bacterium]MBI3736534.1 4a-hydroxytetrahydrobiopterin dehydratase [Candidatus Sumerlaeota bacterium]
MSAKVLPADEIEKRLPALEGWKLDEKALKRQLVFRDFREAVSFLVLIAFDAEEADHHPDVTINYKRLNFSLSTHSEGGVTEKDFALAAKINAAFGAKRSGA